MPPLIDVRGLSVQYRDGKGWSPALEGITFDLSRGEVVGILGESGSGKTTIGLSLLRLLPPAARIVRGSVKFRGRELLDLGESELESIRGAEIAMVFQEPELVLNPFMCALDQVQEVIGAHRNLPRAERREQARKALANVQLERLSSAYPHQLSGGERQRLVIAQALACHPALLIADEPASALDPTLQAEWSALINGLRDRLGLALLLITHSPSTLAGLANRVLVLYAGRIIEEAQFEQIIRRPRHPYTQALLHSIPPPPGTGKCDKRLPSIPATPSLRAADQAGCPFEPRCPERLPRCSQQEPPDIVTSDPGRVRCFKYGE
jgi:oligopeptide/dipeptide ABC transporter ATP-binding protein